MIERKRSAIDLLNEALSQGGRKGDGARLLNEAISERWPAAANFPPRLRDDRDAMRGVLDFITKSRLSEQVQYEAAKWLLRVTEYGNATGRWHIALPYVPVSLSSRELSVQKKHAQSARTMENCLPLLWDLTLPNADHQTVLFAMAVAIHNGGTTRRHFAAALQAHVEAVNGWPVLTETNGRLCLPLVPATLAAFPRKSLQTPIRDGEHAYRKFRRALVDIDYRFEALPATLPSFLAAARARNRILGVALLSEAVRGDHKCVSPHAPALETVLTGRSLAAQVVGDERPRTPKKQLRAEYQGIVDACSLLRRHGQGTGTDAIGKKTLRLELERMANEAHGAMKFALRFLHVYAKRNKATSVERAAYAIQKLFRDSDVEWEVAEEPAEILRVLRQSRCMEGPVEKSIRNSFSKFLACESGVLIDPKQDISATEDALVDANLISPREYRKAMALLKAQGEASRHLVITLFLMYRADMRVSEVALLQRGDLEPGSALDLTIDSRRSKSTIGRRLPLGAMLSRDEATMLRAEWQRSHLADLETPLLIREDGSPLDANDLSECLGDVLTQVCGRRVYAHHLRHTAINRLLAALLSLETYSSWSALHGFCDTDTHDGDKILFPRIRAAVFGEHNSPSAWHLAALAGHVSPATTLGSYVHLHEYFFAVQRAHDLPDSVVAAIAKRLKCSTRTVRRHMQEGDWPSWCCERLHLKSNDDARGMAERGSSITSTVSANAHALTLAIASLRTCLKVEGKPTPAFEVLESSFQTRRGSPLWPGREFANLRPGRERRIIAVAAELAAFIKERGSPDDLKLLDTLVAMRVPRRNRLSGTAKARQQFADLIERAGADLRTEPSPTTGIGARAASRLDSLAAALPLAWIALTRYSAAG